MKNNKSPGNDGFTVEFYCTFWLDLGDMLVGALNEAYNRGGMSNSQKQGVITLIEKEGKNAMYVKNYRPITLLNVDYKILSKVLARRIKEVLGEIVHHDQVGYIKDRNIGEAVRLIDDMFFSSLNQNNGYLAAADFEKAFDSVDHDFLFKVLVLSWASSAFFFFLSNLEIVVLMWAGNLGYFGRGGWEGSVWYVIRREGVWDKVSRSFRWEGCFGGREKCIIDGYNAGREGFLLVV